MADKYVLPNGTLKNLVGATSADELDQVAAAIVPLRRRALFAGVVPWTLDAAHLKAIHQHLFQDMFEWAGRTRDEKIRLADRTIAHMPTMMRPGSPPFAHGNEIATKLDDLFKDLKRAKLLTGLDRDAFADAAAEVFTRLNDIHPFRDGNGRTQRAFIECLALAAGHKLDFSVVSNERNIDVSIRSRQGEPEAMRRLFREIANPQRVAVLRTAQEFLERNNREWRGFYMATTEPGQAYPDLVLVGTGGANFMARTSEMLLVGWRTDLPDPEPALGERFAIARTRPRFGVKKKASKVLSRYESVRRGIAIDHAADGSPFDLWRGNDSGNVER